MLPSWGCGAARQRLSDCQGPGPDCLEAFTDRYGNTVYDDGREDEEVVDWNDDPVGQQILTLLAILDGLTLVAVHAIHREE
jgi:hypothetical protein